MSNFLSNIEIRNFKSVKHLDLGCKRVNIFIGKPNVGKSNILEALSLLAPHYMSAPSRDNRFMAEMVRYEELSNWFYDDDVSKEIWIGSDKVAAQIRYEATFDNLNFMLARPDILKSFSSNSFRNIQESQQAFDKATTNWLNEPDYYAQPVFANANASGYNISNIQTEHYNPIKPFRFSEPVSSNNKFRRFLIPPFGHNLFGVVDAHKTLRQEIAEMFEDYDFEFVLSRKEGKFELQKKLDGIVYKYPYAGVADTFKRLIFYLAAIESNQDSVLILEEPEVHAFPPYTKQLADRIALCIENQFFLTTHSPYLLDTLIENLSDDDIAVFLVYFEDYQTKVSPMSSADLREVQDFSMDVFFNLDKFTHNGTIAHSESQVHP
ncbi:MAG: AAA family ATPase [Saprospiraceae bacterium]